MNQNITEDQSQWKPFFRFAAISALLIVFVAIMDVVISMSAGESKPNNAIGITEWFTMFETNGLSALSNLGLINILTLTLGVPVYLSLFTLFRGKSMAFSMLSMVFFFIGTAVYLSSNTVFSMLALSQQYATATEAQKPLIEAAGRAALSLGADLTPGTFIGLLFSQIAGGIMSIVMLKTKIFSPINGWLGLIGFTMMIVFFSMTAFAPKSFTTAMLISMVGGLTLMAYHIMLAIKLFKFSRA